MTSSPRFLVGVGMIVTAVALFLYGAVSGLPQPGMTTTPPAPSAIGIDLLRLTWDGLTHAAIPGFLIFAGVLFVVQEVERTRGDKVG